MIDTKNALAFWGALTISSFLLAQDPVYSTSIWTETANNFSTEQALRIVPTEYNLYHLDLPALQNILLDCKKRSATVVEEDMVIVAIPIAGNKNEQFGFFETPVMEPVLQAKYPSIRTYTGKGIDDPRKAIKLEMGPKGVQAMIFSPTGNMIVSPAYEDDSAHYMVCRKDALMDHASSFQCELDDFDLSSTASSTGSITSLNPTGTELRTYRMALGVTGEYSTYHGGTKELALAAMATSMNRINQIYERDFTITMVLVNNTDTLIYLDPDTDPYTNNDLGEVLGENQQLCDSLIGVDNYDIGHVFGTSGGGLAGVGVVCGGVKAWGATGLGNPAGEFFDVDYVSHEIGHQFSGGHTFNECGGQGPQAYEPGSGVTIMAYAGLCGESNLQSNSIDQFHVASYDQVIFYSQMANGNTCPAISETGNTAPLVEVSEGGFFIPYNTPFELTGSATDTDGDALTYCWEQFDLGPLVVPTIALGTAPLFRSWRPVDHPTRIFPRIEDLVTNTQTIGELLPQFGRELNFRMTVRDNALMGGGVNYDQITFHATDSSGNFRVLSPNGGDTWTVGSVQTIQWDVANSDRYPVNCNAVNIWLSEDGGFTYPHLVGVNRDNNGTAVITVPNLIGDNIRVKVKAADNIFFDISNNNNTILAAFNPDFSVTVIDPTATICGTGVAMFQIALDTIMGFSENVQLAITDPIAGVTYEFSNNDLPPPADIVLSVSDVDGVLPGDYTFTLQASGDGIVKNIPLTLKIRTESPQQVSLVAPFNGSTNVPEEALFSWNAVAWASTYAIEISDTPDFSNIIQSAANLTQTSYTTTSDLLANSVYFWRVRVQSSACGSGPWSNTFSFQTIRSECVLYGSETVGVSISAQGTPTVYSELNIAQDYTITDADVLNLSGIHTWMNDLRFTLISPANDSTLLFGNICGNQDNFDLAFDDDATETDIPCPPTTGLTYQPFEPLAIFNGSSSFGLWRLKIEDTANQDGGELQNWNLRLCGPTIDDMPATVSIIPDSVILGAVLTLDNENLNGACGDGTSDVTYQITSLPTHGILLLNGSPLAIGATFTQTDIDDQSLTYENAGLDETADSFGFLLTCADGGYIGGLVYNITVLDPVDVSVINYNQYWKLFPNPTGGVVTLESSFPDVTVAKIQLIDLWGRVVFAQALDNDSRQVLDISHLPAGVYNCQLLSSHHQLIGTKKIVLAD